MFVTNDYLNFFEEILKIEVNMENIGHEIKSHTTNPQTHDLLKVIIADEKKHQQIVKHIIALVKGEITDIDYGQLHY